MPTLLPFALKVLENVLKLKACSFWLGGIPGYVSVSSLTHPIRMFSLDKSCYKSQTHQRQARGQLQARVDQPGAHRSLVCLASRTIFSSCPGSSEYKMTTSAVSFLSAVFSFREAKGAGRTASRYVPRCVFCLLNWDCRFWLFLGKHGRKVSYVMTKHQLWLNVWFGCTRKHDWIFLKNLGK